MNYRISRNLEYALMALSYMFERQGQRVSVRDIVKELKCPFHPFSRVMQKLVDHKIISSKQGVKGGYLLDRDLDKLSLYHLMSALFSDLEIASCLYTEAYCDLWSSCNIKKPIRYLNKKLMNFYKQISLKEILSCDGKQIRMVSGRKTACLELKGRKHKEHFL